MTDLEKIEKAAYKVFKKSDINSISENNLYFIISFKNDQTIKIADMVLLGDFLGTEKIDIQYSKNGRTESCSYSSELEIWVYKPLPKD